MGILSSVTVAGLTNVTVAGLKRVTSGTYEGFTKVDFSRATDAVLSSVRTGGL